MNALDLNFKEYMSCSIHKEIKMIEEDLKGDLIYSKRGLQITKRKRKRKGMQKSSKQRKTYGDKEVEPCG